MATSKGESTELEYEEAHVQDTHVVQLLVVFAMSMVIGYGAVALRLICRRMGRTRLGWDDGIIIFSLVTHLTQRKERFIALTFSAFPYRLRRT